MVPSDNTAEYYQMRQAQQLELAANAQSDRVRNIHLELAKRYAVILDEMAATPGGSAPRQAPWVQ